MPTILSRDTVIILNGWACVDTGQHNCAGGTAEANYAHERWCGLEPVEPVTRATIRRVFLWSVFEHRWQVNHLTTVVSFVHFENAVKFANDCVIRAVLNG